MAGSDEGIAVRKLEGPGFDTPAGAPFSKALVVGDEIVISGVTARGSDGVTRGGDDMGAQATAILEEIVRTVEAAGGHVGNIYKIIIYVTDMSRRAAVNEARARVLVAPYPASTMVEVKGLVAPDLLVEIDAFANLRVDLRALA